MELAPRLFAGTMSVRARCAWSAATLAGVLAAASGAAQAASLPTVCLFRLVSGWPCPSCGMTRAFLALGHLHLAEAMRHNIASPVVYLAAWVGLVVSGTGAITSHVPLAAAWRRARPVVLMATLLLMSAAWAANLATAR